MHATLNKIKVYIVYDHEHQQDTALAQAFMATLRKRHPQIELIDHNRSTKPTQDQSAIQALDRSIKCSKAVVVFDTPTPNPDEIISYAAIYNKVVAVKTPHNTGKIASFSVTNRERVITLESSVPTQPYTTGSNKKILEQAADNLWNLINH